MEYADGHIVALVTELLLPFPVRYPGTRSHYPTGIRGYGSPTHSLDACVAWK